MALAEHRNHNIASAVADMGAKAHGRLIHRFSGKRCRARLIDAICNQRVVGDRRLASRLADAGKVLEYPAGVTITQQGSATNEIYFVLSGSVAVTVNGREVARRGAGAHFGEMALVDNTARRSATITTCEPCVFLRVAEARTSVIAAKFPDFWRRVAVELAARLRERTKFIREPNSAPIIFVGSSSEALAEATSLTRALQVRKIMCKLWTQGVFQLSNTAVEDLTKTLADCDFAVLLLTPDDMTISRGTRLQSPRDNLVFELGLFMGGLGRERTYVVSPRGGDIKFPTDILGITRAPYALGAKRSLDKRMRPVAKLIAQQISKKGPK